MLTSPNRPLTVELCVATLDGVHAAATAGADRVEVCRDLACGGLTPDDDLILSAVFACRQRGLDLRILVRHLPDTFVHTPAECAQLVAQIARMRQLLHEDDRVGFVTGALTAGGDIDAGFVREARAAAGGAPLVFHRAIDVAANYRTALETVREAGFNAVLTTGAGGSVASVSGLCQAREVLGAETTVIGSGGLRACNIAQVVSGAGLDEVHFRAPGRGRNSTDPKLAATIVQAARNGQSSADC